MRFLSRIMRQRLMAKSWGRFELMHIPGRAGSNFSYGWTRSCCSSVSGPLSGVGPFVDTIPLPTWS